MSLLGSSSCISVIFHEQSCTVLWTPIAFIFHDHCLICFSTGALNYIFSFSFIFIIKRILQALGISFVKILPLVFLIPYGGTCSIQWKFVGEPQESYFIFERLKGSDPLLQRHLGLQLLKGKF